MVAGGPPLNASVSSQRASQSLWAAAATLNHELNALAPAILSPTSSLEYFVGFHGNNLSAVPIRTYALPHA